MSATAMRPDDALRVETISAADLKSYRARGDRIFAGLMVVQWLFAVAIAVTWSPYAWSGTVATTHIHVWYALIGGAVLTLPVLALASSRPGESVTRYTVSVHQMLYSALFIHLTGGRIETHFHVFGSLAFLAYYRDWRVILSSTGVVVVDHLTRELLWPQSVYGTDNPEWWRFLEHAAWVVFEDVILLISIRESLAASRMLALRQIGIENAHASLEARVVERTAELLASRDQFRVLVEGTKAIPWQADATGTITYVGPQGPALLGNTADEWRAPGFLRATTHAEDRDALDRLLAAHEKGMEAELRLVDRAGNAHWVRGIANHHGDGVHGILLDVSERRRLEAELRLAQKLETVGRLAAGVAHEINTPVQFVSDSVKFLHDGFGDVVGLLSAVTRSTQELRVGADTARVADEVEQALERADADYLIEAVPKATSRAIEGLDHIARIVRSMKELSHPSQAEAQPIDIGRVVERAVVLTSHETKLVADVSHGVAPGMMVMGFGSELSQVLMNLIVNATHAIVAKRSESRGRIEISLAAESGYARIEVSDNGAGIPESIRERIFDPFFTTKEVGTGTGQGLSLVRSIIVDRHGGTISFDSTVGVGTTFDIRIPLIGA